MKSCGRLVEYVQCTPGITLGKLCGQLDALALTSGERRRRLPETYISKPDILEGFYLGENRGYSGEEIYCLVDCHIKDVSYRFTLVSHFESLTVIAPAVTFLARDHNIGQEIHLYRPVSVASTCLTSSSSDIE